MVSHALQAAAFANDDHPRESDDPASASHSVDLEIVNRLGLHARAAAKFVRTASAFTSDISVSHQNQTVSGRSIMGLMMLGACKGTTISVSARGSDAPEALQAIRDLVSGRFHEAD